MRDEPVEVTNLLGAVNCNVYAVDNIAKKNAEYIARGKPIIRGADGVDRPYAWPDLSEEAMAEVPPWLHRTQIQPPGEYRITYDAELADAYGKGRISPVAVGLICTLITVSIVVAAVILVAAA